MDSIIFWGRTSRVRKEGEITMNHFNAELTRMGLRQQRMGKRRYITGFDGIRTLAVLGGSI